MDFSFVVFSCFIVDLICSYSLSIFSIYKDKHSYQMQKRTGAFNNGKRLTVSDKIDKIVLKMDRNKKCVEAWKRCVSTKIYGRTLKFRVVSLKMRVIIPIIYTVVSRRKSNYFSNQTHTKILSVLKK